MHKELTVSVSNFGNDKVFEVIGSNELNGFHKAKLRLSKDKIERYKRKIKSIHDENKGASTYMRTVLEFSPIDYYSGSEYYEIPYMVIGSGARKVTDDVEPVDDIPKDWSEDIIVRFVNCKQYGAILKAISTLGWSLTEKEIKDLKKALKEGKSFYKDNY